MDLPRYHLLRASYYRLEGRRCRDCGTVEFPAQPRCPRCHGRSLDPYALSGHGSVYSFAEIGQPPRDFAGPYLVAIVELAEGPRITAQLTDVERGAVHIGLPVEMVTRRLQEKAPQGYLVYGYKFRPRLEAASDGSPSALTSRGGSTPSQEVRR